MFSLFTGEKDKITIDTESAVWLVWPTFIFMNIAKSIDATHFCTNVWSHLVPSLQIGFSLSRSRVNGVMSYAVSASLFLQNVKKTHEIQIRCMWSSIIYASPLSNYTVKRARFRWFYGEKGDIYNLFDCCLFFPGKRHGDMSAQWQQAEQQWASHSLHHWYQHSQVSVLPSFCKIVFHCGLRSFEHLSFFFFVASMWKFWVSQTTS